MRVRVGPVSSGSVTMWVAYARTVLAYAIARPGSRPSLSPDVISGFESFLDEWEALAAQDTEFVWSADVEPDRVEFLAHAWFGIAEELAGEAEQRGFPLSPPEGEEFYQALVQALLSALSHDARSRVEFAEQLRDRWPGLKQD